MVTAEQMRLQAQPKLLRLVGLLVAEGHPTMQAYRKIGREIGRQPSWVQRVIGRRDQVTVGAHDWFNISALCDRLDAVSTRNEAAAQALREDTDAVIEARAVRRSVAEIDRQQGDREGAQLVGEVRR